MQPINLTWLDANVFNDENKQTLEKLRNIFQRCMEFTEKDECQRFLGRGHNDPRRFILVVSGAMGQDLVPEIHDHRNILSIYVYCGWREKHEKWSAEYRKVKVVTSVKELITGLESDKESYESQ